MTWEDVLVDGASISALGYRIIQVWDGAHTAPGERGNWSIVPGRDGVIDQARPYDASSLGLGLQLRGASLLTGLNDLKRALIVLCKPGQQVTLTRKLSYSTGNETHTAPGRVDPASLAPQLLTPAIARVALRFSVLSGLWYGSAVAISGIDSTFVNYTVAGETRTRRLTITLPGAGVLTCSTTGLALTVDSACILNVENRSSNGPLADVHQSGDPLGAWFHLVAGVNRMKWVGAGGTASISYSPAYL